MLCPEDALTWATEGCPLCPELIDDCRLMIVDLRNHKSNSALSDFDNHQSTIINRQSIPIAAKKILPVGLRQSEASLVVTRSRAPRLGKNGPQVANPYYGLLTAQHLHR